MLRTRAIRASFELIGGSGIAVTWIIDETDRLRLMANLGPEGLEGMPAVKATPFYASHAGIESGLNEGVLPPWSVAWLLDQTAEKKGA